MLNAKSMDYKSQYVISEKSICIKQGKYVLSYTGEG